MRAVFWGLTLCMAATPAAAGNWSYATHSDSTAVGIDWDSVRVTGASRSAWTLFAQYERVGQGAAAFDYALQRITVNCDAETMAIHSVVKYRLDDSHPVDNVTNITRFDAVIPDTIGSGITAAICGAEPTEAGVGNAAEFAAMVRRIINEPASDE